MVGNTGSGLFGSNNPNTSFGQSKPVGTGFSFGTPVAQPTANIFGTPQTSTAGTGMFGASTAGNIIIIINIIIKVKVFMNLKRCD